MPQGVERPSDRDGNPAKPIEFEDLPESGFRIQEQPGRGGNATPRSGSKPARDSVESNLSIGAPSFSPYHPTSISGLGFLRCQMLLEFLHLRVDHQLAVSLGRILGEIVLVIVFCSIEML